MAAIQPKNSVSVSYSKVGENKPAPASALSTHFVDGFSLSKKKQGIQKNVLKQVSKLLQLRFETTILEPREAQFKSDISNLRSPYNVVTVVAVLGTVGVNLGFCQLGSMMDIPMLGEQLSVIPILLTFGAFGARTFFLNKKREKLLKNCEDLEKFCGAALNAFRSSLNILNLRGMSAEVLAKKTLSYDSDLVKKFAELSRKEQLALASQSQDHNQSAATLCTQMFEIISEEICGWVQKDIESLEMEYLLLKSGRKSFSDSLPKAVFSGGPLPDDDKPKKKKNWRISEEEVEDLPVSRKPQLPVSALPFSGVSFAQDLLDDLKSYPGSFGKFKQIANNARAVLPASSKGVQGIKSLGNGWYSVKAKGKFGMFRLYGTINPSTKKLELTEMIHKKK